MAGLLEKDPKKRFSAMEAYNSNFFSQYDSVSSEITSANEEQGTNMQGSFSDEEEILTPVYLSAKNKEKPLDSKLIPLSKSEQIYTIIDEYGSEEDEEEEIPTPLFSKNKMNENSYI